MPKLVSTSCFLHENCVQRSELHASMNVDLLHLRVAHADCRVLGPYNIFNQRNYRKITLVQTIENGVFISCGGCCKVRRSPIAFCKSIDKDVVAAIRWRHSIRTSFLIHIYCIVHFIGSLTCVHHASIRDRSRVYTLQLHVLKNLQYIWTMLWSYSSMQKSVFVLIVQKLLWCTVITLPGLALPQEQFQATVSLVAFILCKL